MGRLRLVSASAQALPAPGVPLRPLTLLAASMPESHAAGLLQVAPR